jgi:HEAT repeat protein
VRALPLLALLLLVCLLAGMFLFILGRRLWRGRVLRRQDRWRQHWLRRLPDLLAGEIPAPGELRRPEACETLETLLVDRLQTATGENQELLSIVLERSGLLDRRIALLRHGRRWERLASAALLGQMRAPAAVSALLGALEEGWPLLRAAATRSLGMIACPAAGPPLVRTLLRGHTFDPNIWLDAVVACQPDPNAFLPLLEDIRPELRALGARAIAESAAAARFESLSPGVFDPDPDVRAQLLRALGRTSGRMALPLLVAATADPVWFVRLRALAALGERNDAEALPAVLRATRDAHFQVRQRAAATLARLAARPAGILRLLVGGNDRYALEGFLSELARAGLLWRSLPLLVDSDAALRHDAQELLTWALSAGSYQEVLHAVEAHPDRKVRIAAARLLAHAGKPSLLPELRRRQRDTPSARVRRILGLVIRALEPTFLEVPVALAHPV